MILEGRPIEPTHTLKRKLRSAVKHVPGTLYIYRLLQRSGAKSDLGPSNQQLQRLIVNQYRDSLSKGAIPYTKIADSGFRCHSQFEEDGIILYVLSMIGMKTKKVVEISCGDGSECMSTNLILNHGYQGFLFDGDAKRLKKAIRFFSSKKDSRLTPPTIKLAWVTRENVNQLLKDIGSSGEVDLLSLDIDGNDYWVWDAISEISPRLCVFETHNIIPSDKSLTIPYDPQFNCWIKEGHERDFRSVSLLAMKNLSERKGYRMIGSHKHGFNVFFLRNDIGQDIFPEVMIAEVHDNPWTRAGQSERWPLVRDMSWEEV